MVVYLRVRRPHFDRHRSGTLEAGKLRARVYSVKSEWHPRRCDPIGRFATTTASATNKNLRRNSFLFFLGHACFSFLVKKNFVCDEK